MRLPAAAPIPPLSLASLIPNARATSAQEAVDRCSLVFITTPDAAIREVCESLAWRAGVAVAHTSGVESSAILEKAAREGAATGSFHPLQTFAAVPPALNSLAGSIFAVEAEGALRSDLLAMVDALGGTPIELRPEDKALYHASAVMIGNYTVTLAKMATDLWLRLGWERPAAMKALLPLLHGAVANIEALGLPQALTGPIARGDVATVARHLETLAAAAPDMLEAYRELALQTIPVALAKGGLSDPAAFELRSLLESKRQAASPSSGQPGREGATPKI